MGANLAASIFKMLLSKKILLLVLRKYVKSTDNTIDDNIVNIVDGGLNQDVELMTKGVIALIDEAVPAVIDVIKNR